MTFQFWGDFSFGDISVLVTFQFSVISVFVMQNSALSKQSTAVNTICLILTIEVDGELGKVKGIKSYLQ